VADSNPVSLTCLPLHSFTPIAPLRAHTPRCLFLGSPTFATRIGTERRPQKRPRAPTRFGPIRNDSGPLFRQVDAGEKRADRAPGGRIEGRKDVPSQDSFTRCRLASGGKSSERSPRRSTLSRDTMPAGGGTEKDLQCSRFQALKYVGGKHVRKVRVVAGADPRQVDSSAPARPPPRHESPPLS
jgi:hypothetical protein